MTTTLITGGAGFIGSHFVELLFDRSDTDIIVLDAFTYAAHPDNIPDRIRNSPRFELIHGDIRDRTLVGALMMRVERVAHFAAESHVTRSIVDDTAFFETDVMGTQTIAAAASRNDVKKLLHISTSEVYGTAVRAPMDEDHPLNPCTPYAAAKAGADRLIYAYRETYKIPTVIIRPFNNYGPRQHLEKMVPRFITSALCDEPLTVHGNGQMTRDWLYVRDTCEAVLHALRSDDATGEVINLGTGVDTSVQAVAELILDIMGKPRTLIHHVTPRPGQVDRHIASTEKAARLLDWHARKQLRDGLTETIDWYASNRPWWERQRASARVALTDPVRRLCGSY